MRIGFAVLIAAAMFVPAPMSAAELDTALAKIEQVGPKGQGNAAAAAAWQQLAQADATQIPTLLAAMDGENPLAANYLRSAVETIAQRESGNLPADALEKFVRQTDHDPRARRLAYELLLRAEPDAEARLLPTMLDDPSVELRRDAVARLIEKAEKMKAKPDQIAAYQRAFDAAVDDDQVKQLSKTLKELGEDVDIARHYGFVMQWHVIGPFDNADEKGFDKPHGPEGKPLDLDANYKGSHGQGEVAWQQVTSDDDYGRIDLNEELGKHKSAVAYAVATFAADSARPIEIRYQSKNACKVWLNGKLLDAREVYHSDGSPALDQYDCAGRLKEGENTILIKVCQNDQQESWAQDWAFRLRVCDSAGAAVLAANRVEKKADSSDQLKDS